VSQASRPEAAPGRIKGAAFREFVAWYEQELGRAQLLTLLRSIPDDLRRELELDPARESLGILSSRWYPADAIHALLDAIIAGIDPDRRRESIERAADAVMRATLRGVYRILFEWLATPDRYARFADRLWRSYYDSGRASGLHDPRLGIAQRTALRHERGRGRLHLSRDGLHRRRRAPHVLRGARRRRVPLRDDVGPRAAPVTTVAR
jgi:hypothetical protein